MSQVQRLRALGDRVSTDLVACPLCGADKGYQLCEGSTSRWYSICCVACGQEVVECRIAADPAAAWNKAGAYADGLRAEIERLRTELDGRFGIGGELIVARRDRDGALHQKRVAEKVLERLVRRCESEMADTIDVPEIQTAKALLGLGA